MTAPPTVLLDSNIIINGFLQRQPFAQDADKRILLVEDGKLQTSLCANSTTTADYLLYGALGKAIAHEHIFRLLKTFDIAPVNRAVLHDAAQSKLKDFDYAVIAQSAVASGISAIITRNGNDFVGCGLNVYSPCEWLAAT